MGARRLPDSSMGLGKMGPKNKKRPWTLTSLGTPEQPSPRTAQVQNTHLLLRCIFHLRASAWHHAATRLLSQAATGCRNLWECVHRESLAQAVYTSMQRFALQKWNPPLVGPCNIRSFSIFRIDLLWTQTCTLSIGRI